MPADPTPRDPIAHSWTGGAYNGFASEPPARPPPPPRAANRRNLVLGGLAGAVALGLVAGVLFRPQLVEDRAPAPMKAATAEALTPPMPVEVAKPEPLPAPKSAGKLEVLPPELARAAPRPAAPRPPRQPELAVAPSAPEAAAPVVARVAEPPPIPARARPSFDCRNAGTRAERMICGDDELARLDRRLDRAFDRAVSSGIPYRELRAEHDDWLQIREDAARRSSGAVASVYSQRIRELNDLAEGY